MSYFSYTNNLPDVRVLSQQVQHSPRFQIREVRKPHDAFWVLHLKSRTNAKVHSLIFTNFSFKFIRGILPDSRFAFFNIQSLTDFNLYYFNKEIAELHHEMNIMPQILYETDKELFLHLI